MSPEIITSGLVSLSIACIGWFILQWRTNKTSKRSETFAMLSSAFTVLEQIESLAEEHVKKINKTKDVEENLLRRQMFSTKILAKEKFFRTQVRLLERRSINLSSDSYIELRDRLTMSDFSTIVEYQRLMNVTADIRKDLYRSFHIVYPV
ncbi:hypothetical protein [Photobacterium leiognathi]|uniref:hypothetical protein n=1 Tax=Photobacterium leiognathi TaxID=553611 RepID=UPI002980E255|nr:hypothetical protein [Photobacterium leiognathi]